MNGGVRRAVSGEVLVLMILRDMQLPQSFDFGLRPTPCPGPSGSRQVDIVMLMYTCEENAPLALLLLGGHTIVPAAAASLLHFS